MSGPERRATDPAHAHAHPAGEHVPYDVGRFRRFYGCVAAEQNRRILALVRGESLLDLGCGWGQFLRQARAERPGLRCAAGLDYEAWECREAARVAGAPVARGSVFSLPFRAGAFDTIVLREAIHHFQRGGSLDACVRELWRVCRREVVIFDPNVTPFLKWTRRGIGHRDEEAPLDQVLAALARGGFGVDALSFSDLVAFPLSGGLVGPELFRLTRTPADWVLAADAAAVAAVTALGLERALCFRYLLRAVKGA